MHLRKVTEIPAVRRKPKNSKLQDYILEFYDSNMPHAEVIYDSEEYDSSTSLQTGLLRAVEALELQDQINVVVRGRNLFLTKIE